MLAEPIKLLRAICDDTSTLDMQSYGILVMESPIHIMLGKVANAMGYKGLMVKQEEAIVEFMNSKDVFVSLPTGSGKSLCYSILPRAFDAIRL